MVSITNGHILKVGVFSSHVNTQGPPELSLNPLWARGLFISQIKFHNPPPRHSKQLLLIFAQIEVTRINIKTMHSKRKPPHLPGADQTEVIRAGGRDGSLIVTWASIGRFWTSGLDSDKWVSVIRRLRSFGGVTEHHWWLSLSLHISLNVVQFCVSVIFSPQTVSHFTPTQQQGLIYKPGMSMDALFFFFYISAKSDSEVTARSWQDHLRHQGNW